MNDNIRKQIKKEERKARREGHQKLLFMHLKRRGLPYAQAEFKFHPTKKYSIDFAWWFCSVKTREEIKLAVEIEGGIYGDKGGGHRSITGFEANLLKYNALTEQRWWLLRFIPEQLEMRSTVAIDLISTFLVPIFKEGIEL